MIWDMDWRDRVWSQLDQPWDLIVIGGGITGAGILREASRAGLRSLLVDSKDFAYGTSSRSSKLVHGGLRYLKNAQMKTTLESVSERERLLSQGKGLINQLGFLYASMKGDPLPGWVFGMGLVVYDLMARKWTHRAYDADDMRELCPPLTTPILTGGYRYFDAQTDDARLVLRVIREAVQDGAVALNYAPVVGLLRSLDGSVCGVRLQDSEDAQGRQAEVKATVVVNAAGAWADDLRGLIQRPRRLRPLRGSHLVFPAARLPLTRAVSLLHPEDGRPVFFVPWEGVTLLGTTDIDHEKSLQEEPAISSREVEYLLRVAGHAFAELALDERDIQATFSGIRPVVHTGKTNPSKESREHVIWQEDGMLTVSGGKMTTYRVMAFSALNAIRARFPSLAHFDRAHALLNRTPDELEALLSDETLKPAARLRLLGRYGCDAPDILRTAADGELENVGNTGYLWAELRWAARAEGVFHLDDLLLRRVRLGLLLPCGGKDWMPRIRSIVKPELGWSDERWAQELNTYSERWQRCYNVPG